MLEDAKVAQALARLHSRFATSFFSFGVSLLGSSLGLRPASQNHARLSNSTLIWLLNRSTGDGGVLLLHVIVSSCT